MASKQQPRTGTPGRQTKAERKEEARRQREELLRRRARARRNRTIGIAAAVVVAAAVVGVVALTSDNTGSTKPPEPPLPGLLTGPAPWPANLDTLPQRLNRLNLPAFANPLALHAHAHLDLSVNGSPVPVAASIGFDAQAQASLHTHDETGVVHMESSRPDATFTLGEVFDVWGLRLTPTCIGGYCNSGDAQLRTYVDGKPFTGDPRNIRLTDQQEILVAYGTEDQLPNPIPKTYDWATLTP